jgi:hypothetical protein
METSVVTVMRSVVLVELVLEVVVELVTAAAVELVVALIAVVVAVSSSSPQPRCQEGHSTGVRKTMMQTTAARQAPEVISSLALCSMAPSKTERKKPLRRKKRAMLTGLFTAPAYQNEPSAETWRCAPRLRTAADLDSQGQRC